jgi:hypothetical protein
MGMSCWFGLNVNHRVLSLAMTSEERWAKCSCADASRRFTVRHDPVLSMGSILRQVESLPRFTRTVEELELP